MKVQSSKEIQRLLAENHASLHAMIVFHKAERAILSREQAFIRAHDLTPAQFAVLETLYSKGDLRICELLQKLLATSGNMTVILRNMERDGLITKHPDEADQRATRIGLTEKGRSLISSVLPDHIHNVAGIFQPLSDAEKDLLASLLKKLK